MGEGCNISPGHTTQCASAVDDLERKFHRTIRHGTKIQVNEIPMKTFREYFSPLFCVTSIFTQNEIIIDRRISESR